MYAETCKEMLSNCEVTPQAICPIAKSLMKRGGPKAPSAIHGPLGPIFYPLDKSQHNRRLVAVNEDISIIFRLCDVITEIKSLKLAMANGFGGISNQYLRHFPRWPIVHVTRLFSHCLQLGHFPAPWKEAKIITLTKPDKDPKFLFLLVFSFCMCFLLLCVFFFIISCSMMDTVV
jgi:hypothetical protein